MEGPSDSERRGQRTPVGLVVRLAYGTVGEFAERFGLTIPADLVAQFAAQDLADRGLRQGRDEVVGRGHRAGRLQLGLAERFARHRGELAAVEAEVGASVDLNGSYSLQA